MMNIRKTAIATAVLASVIGMTGCSDSNDDAKQIVAPPPTANPVGAAFSITLTDNKGAPLTGTAKVTLQGDGTKFLSQQTQANAAVDLGPLTVTNGVLNLLVSDAIKNEAADVIVTAIIESDGFTSTSAIIRIDPKDPASTVIPPVQLVAFSSDVNDSEEAVVFVDKSEAVTGSTLNTPVKISTQDNVTDKKDATALAGGGATLTIADDVQLQKADGTPISGSQVQVRMNYFSNEPNGSGASNASALDSFPGGFDVVSADVEGSTDTVEDFSFISAGFVAVDITTDQGEAVKKFDKPVAVEMKIPEDTVWNVEADQQDVIDSEVPDTEIGKSLKDIQTRHAGKKLLLPVWSYEEAEGKWTKATNPAEVVLDTTDPTKYDATNKAYITTMQVEHLSYWNLDWVKTARCNPRSSVVDIFFNDGQTPNAVAFLPSMTASGFSGSRYFWSDDPGKLHLYNTPDIDLKLSIDIGGESVIGAIRTNAGGTFSTADVANGMYSGKLCDVNAIRLTKSAEDFTLVTPKVKVQSVCAQDATKVTAQPAWVYLFGQNYFHYRDLTAGGTATFPAVVGDSTTLSVYTFVDGLGQQLSDFSFTPQADEVTISYEVQCEVEDPTGGSGGSGGTGGSTGN